MNRSGNRKGCHLTQEQKDRLSKIRKGKVPGNRKGCPQSVSQRKKQSEFMKGNSYLKGKTWSLSDEVKEKYREVGLLRVNDEFRIRMREMNTGRKFSENTRRKISSFAKTRIGALNSNWNEGSSFLPYPSTFNKILKMKIEEKFQHTCQICGKIKMVVNSRGWAVHHIDYNKENNDELNLIFLCSFCHNKTNGIKNRDVWEFIFNAIVSERKEVMPNGREFLSLACAQ